MPELQSKFMPEFTEFHNGPEDMKFQLDSMCNKENEFLPEFLSGDTVPVSVSVCTLIPD